MNPEAIVFGEEITTDYSKAREKEWIITNSLGGYASSTITGANTRGYHGLLVVCVPPALKRMLLLSKLEEEIIFNGEMYPLSINRYPDTTYPDGNKYLKEFRLDPLPSFLYQAGEVVLKKTVFMPPGQNSSVISYKVSSPTPIELLIRPLVNCRSFHSRTSEDSGIVFRQHPLLGGVGIDSSEDAPSLYLKSNVGKYESSEIWYRNMVYDEEIERGLNDREDHLSPGFFKAMLQDQDVFNLVASVDASVTSTELAPKGAPVLSRVSLHCSSFHDWLIQASDQFIVRLPGNRKTVVAGYHWFGEWGRDAAVALPGLLLTTARFEEAKDVIRRFLDYTRNGLVPVYFGEDGEPGYASIDTSLWLIYAVYKHFSYTDDLQFVEEVYPRIRDIVEWYQRGTDVNSVAGDNLLETKSEEGSLTWMDARVGGVPVTPRGGKCIEVNALWYNALRSIEKLSSKLGEDPEPYKELGLEVRKSFNDVFWYREGGYLYDCVNNDIGDDSIRPNQILSISLPFPVLGRERWGSVFKIVERYLLTPYGLRTLAPQDSRYRGRCSGGPEDRDSAYHNGTVWAWLVGPFITAYVRLGWNPNSPMIRHILQSFNKHLGEAGLGNVSEIFDGDAPHRPRGCIAQAWSVGELLRVYSEDLKGFKEEPIA